MALDDDDDQHVTNCANDEDNEVEHDAHPLVVGRHDIFANEIENVGIREAVAFDIDEIARVGVVQAQV